MKENERSFELDLENSNSSQAKWIVNDGGEAFVSVDVNITTLNESTPKNLTIIKNCLKNQIKDYSKYYKENKDKDVIFPYYKNF